MYNAKKGYVYILFSKRNGTLYTGVTSDLVRRIYEHKNKSVEGFTFKYGVDKLGYYEIHESITCAIEREKKIKGGSRKKIGFDRKHESRMERLIRFNFITPPVIASEAKQSSALRTNQLPLQPKSD